MSSPAVSCSRRYTDNASTYCSRKRLMTIASRNDLSPRFSVYQLGRGNDPVTVVGSSWPAVAFNIECVSSYETTKDPIRNIRTTQRSRRSQRRQSGTCVLRDLCVEGRDLSRGVTLRVSFFAA